MKKSLLSDRVYTYLKWTAAILLPLLGTLYYGLAQIWGLPHTASVMGTLASVNAFLGGVLGFSTVSYGNSDAKYDGVINVVGQSDGMPTASMVVHGDPVQALNTKDSLTFKVNVPAAQVAEPNTTANYVSPLPPQQ